MHRSDGFALEIRFVQSSQLVRNAQATARGGRMLGARGALPGYASEISRQSRLPQRTVAERMRTMIFSRQIKWKDISALCPHPLSSRDEGEWGGSAVDDSTGQCRWSVVRRRAQEKAFRMALESLQKTLPKQSRETPPILGLDLNSGLGLKRTSEQGEEPFVEAGLLRNTDSTSITRMYSESGPTYFSPQGTSHAGSMCGTCGNYHIVEECRVHIQEGRCTKATSRRCGANWFLNKHSAENRWETDTWETTRNNICTQGTGL